jgi:glycosyltransferase involved in cell wall biosynthesis
MYLMKRGRCLQLLKQLRTMLVSARRSMQMLAPQPDWFDSAWYLRQYTDVAASGISPWLHYCRYGKREGRLPAQDRAQPLDHMLWRGAYPVAVQRLYRLLDANDLLEHEAINARYALARWYVWQQAWDKVIAVLSPDGKSLGVSCPQPLLLLLEALCRRCLSETDALQHCSSQIDNVIGQLALQFPQNTDTDLARANGLLTTQADDTSRLATINQCFARHQLPELTLRDSSYSLSLDNLSTECVRPWQGDEPELISVIIPVYNAEATIATTLRSLFAQNWPRLEILVVDDASTDSSLAVIAAVRSECPGHIKLLLLQQPDNRGAYAARNRGLASANGEFITVHDGDDWSHPCKLALQADALRQQPHAQACLSWWVRVTDDLLFHRWRLDDYGWCYPNISSLMFRRRVHRVLGFWDDVRVNADTEFRERIEAAYDRDAVVEVLPGVPLAFGRADDNSLSQQSDTHLHTVYAGLRYAYMHAARAWHARAQAIGDLYIPQNPGSRAFAAPARMLRAGTDTVENPVAKDRICVNGCFDAGWYLQRYIHLQQVCIDPFEHFWQHANAEGLDPNPDFSTSGYLRLHPEAAKLDNPLIHAFRPHDVVVECLPVWSGQPRRPSRPTVMVCGHLAGKRLFGAERSLLDVLVALSALEFNLIVTLPEAMNADYEQHILTYAHALVVLPYGWWQKGRLPDSRTVTHFRHLIERFQVDAVHANTLVLDEPLRAAREKIIPTLVHVRELPAADKALCDVLGADAAEIVMHAVDLADRLIANSRHTAVELQRLIGEQCLIDTVPNSFDMSALCALPELERGPRESVLSVGMLSSHVPKKGLADIEQLAVRLHQSKAPIKLILFGPETDALRAVLSDVEGSGAHNLEYRGYVESAEQALVSLDVVLNLSHFQESFGRTVLEAMAAARPVVAYEWGALPELIEHGKTGFFAPLGNVQAVADYLEQLAADRTLCCSLGCAGRKRAKQVFGYDSMVESLAHVYKQAGIV